MNQVNPTQTNGSAHKGETTTEEKHTKECRRECKAYREMVEKIHTFEKMKGSYESEWNPSTIMEDLEEPETCEESCMERKDFEEKQKKQQQQIAELYRLLKPKLVKLMNGLEDLVMARFHRIEQDIKLAQVKEKKAKEQYRAGKITYTEMLRQGDLAWSNIRLRLSGKRPITVPPC